jgi:hypothetical protein
MVLTGDGIRVQTNVLMTDITTENGHVLMNVVTPALNGIDININGAALCTFLPSFSVRTDRHGEGNSRFKQLCERTLRTVHLH